MLGPYDYTPPVYWFTDKKLGGAYGFNTETGPGAQVPPLESIKKMIPTDQLWPIGEIWDFHCARYEFSSLSRFKNALNERYGEPKSLEEFDIKAQAMNYELMRPMFEAFRANKNRATGVIQWMLNAAWPKMYWQLYDHYLMPNGAFYGTRKACQPLNLIYNYGDKHIYLTNEYLYAVKNLNVRIRVYNVHSELLFDEERHVTAERDSSAPILKIPQLKNLTKTFFLDNRLTDAQGKEISTNLYWLSTKSDVLDYEAKIGDFGFYTPSKEYADLTQLNTLSKVELNIQHRFEQSGKDYKVGVELENPGDNIAFFIDLKIVNKISRDVILPIFWDDNYLSLLPGERRTVSADFESEQEVELIVSGWNTV
jgi:exo-1,4-beta-D-glucosaminidase